jgi:RNA polymerase sigma factor (sigma-70 family)
MTMLDLIHDSELIRRSLEQPEAFAELYDRHAAPLHRYVARRLGPQLAEDITAETFTAAFRRRAHYRAEYTDARPWLYGIAANLIGRHRRSEVRMLRALARSHTPAMAVGDGDDHAIDERLCAAAAGPALARALAGLPADQRDVLLLFAWAELSYDEIAAALELPVGTVRSRLSRARQRMQDALDPGEKR